MLLALWPTAGAPLEYLPWTVGVEIALDKSPLDLPGPGDWTALGPARAFSFRRGKQDKLGDYQPGSATITLDNAAFDLDQLLSTSILANGHALPATPVRLRATSAGGTVRTLFSGYTKDGFTPDGSAKGGGTVVVELTDWLGWASSVDFPDSIWEAWTTYQAPDLWWTGAANRQAYDSTTEPDYLWNMARRWAGSPGPGNGDMTMTSGGASTVQRGPSIVPGCSNPSIQFQTATPTALTMNAGDAVAASGLWSAQFWVKLPAPGVTLAVGGTGVGGNSWDFWIDGSGFANARVRVGGFDKFAQVALNHADGNAHLIALGVKSQSGFATNTVYLSTDLGLHWPSGFSNGASGGGVLHITGSGGATCYVDEVAYWGSKLAEYGFYGVAGWAGGILDPNVLDTIPTRVPKVYGECATPDPGTELHLSDPTRDLADEPVASSLADALVQLGETYLGATYCRRDGTVRIRDYSYTGSTNPDDYSTVIGQLTDDPAATYAPRVIRVEKRKRTGTRRDRVVNEVTVALKTGRDIYYFDGDSQARYGRASKTYRSQAATARHTIAPAQAVLAAAKDPHVEIAEVVVSPYDDQAATDFVMDLVELDRVVIYREATPANVPVVNYFFRIIGESWDWSNGVEGWKVTLRLATI